MDSRYTEAKADQQRQSNQQTVQNWWRSEQAKTAQDNSTTRAYTAKLTGGANIDNAADVLKSLQRTFGGANDSAKTQNSRTLKSKMGYGRNWGNPRSAVGNTIESGIAGTAAGWLNAVGTALKSDRRSGLAVDSGKIDVKATGNEWYNRAGSYLQKEADWAQMLSENAYLRGSRGLNNAQTLLFDGAVAGTQIAGDLALGMLTGSSATIPMTIRSFGSASQQARQAGATENQQIAYGAASAFKEALTEKMFDGLAGVYGKGTADDFVDALTRNFSKSDVGQALVRGLVNMGGEGLEEVVSGFADPALQGIYNGRTLGENYSELNARDLWHDGAVGMFLGSLGGAVDIAQAGQDTTGRTGLSTPYSDILREKRLSTPYSDMLREKQHYTSYSDVMNATAATENQAANHAEHLRYQELLYKFLDGSIAEEEFDELRKLENVWGQFDWANEYASGDSQTEGNIPAIANSVDDNYNESTQDLFRRYTSSIDSGELSPLADFALYQQINDEMDRLFNSVVTSNGIAITGKSSHSVARVIGSVEQRRSGVSVADVLHALTDEDSEVLPIKVFKNGRSQKFRSDKVEVSVNPDTGIIIQVNPVHSKRKVKQ